MRFIYLKGSRELIQRRIQGREGHFMPPALLASQFGILEEPVDAIVVPVEMALDEMVRQVLMEARFP
jgi:gluconokinase